jgi:D-arabinose 1-dehydrogenase-like Zn-dependent alcohol dehydrogenase
VAPRLLLARAYCHWAQLWRAEAELRRVIELDPVEQYARLMKQLQVLGSLSGTQQDLTELYELMRGGQLNPPNNRITPEGIPEGLDPLRKGGVTGRLIALHED